MVYIAKNMSEYQMKRKKAIEHLDQSAKHLDLIKKMVKQRKESGTPLFEGYVAKDGLESLLDKAKVDENLEKKLVGIGARVSIAKQWVQSLESPIKEYVLDRFPFFAKIFEKNYGIVSVNNLNATFRLFNQQMMDQQKVVRRPSRESIKKVLEAANSEVRQRFMNDLIKSNKSVENWYNRLSWDGASSASISDVLNEFFNAFSNEMDAFSAISYVGSKLGLIFPTVEVTSGDGDDDSVFTDADSYTTPDSPSWSASESLRGSFPYSTASDTSEHPWSSLSMSQDDDSPLLVGRPLDDEVEVEDDQASFFTGEANLAIIDPGDYHAVTELAALYSAEDLLNFFKLRDDLPALLYPGTKTTYNQAMARVRKMKSETRVKKLAELGFNFKTLEFP